MTSILKASLLTLVPFALAAAIFGATQGHQQAAQTVNADAKASSQVAFNFTKITFTFMRPSYVPPQQA